MKLENKKIVVLADVSGMCVGYHVGDEAMAEVSIDRLSNMFGRENLILFCASPSSAANTYNVKAYPLYSRTKKQRFKSLLTRPHSVLSEFFRLVFCLWQCDLVFISGGGNHTSVWPHVLESRLYFLRLARYFKKPYIFASQTLGPFSDAHRSVCQDVFSSASWIGVRDREYSSKQLDVPVHFAVDDAVFLPLKYDEQTRNIARKHKKLIGLSLRGFQGATDQHRENLCRALAAYAHKVKASTVFLPHHAPERLGDLDIAHKIKHIWSNNSPFLIIDPVPYASAVKALTQNCFLVVTMRYHQLIFSLSLGIPSVGIYVEEYTKAKLNGAFEQFGLKAHLLSIEEAPDKLETIINEALSLKNEFHKASVNVKGESLEENLKVYKRAFEIVGK